MIVVSNSSPIIFLCKIEKLNLLLKLYKTIQIPKKVFEELSKQNYESSQFKYYLPHFNVEATEKKIFGLKIHEGESEAITLALKKMADLILLDDKKARIIAKNIGLKTMGTLGILLNFLDKKFIDYEQFKSLLKGLINANFRISITLYDEVLKQAEYIDKLNKWKKNSSS